MPDVVPFLERLLKRPLYAGAWLALGLHITAAAAALRLTLLSGNDLASLGLSIVIASLFLTVAVWCFEVDYLYLPVRVMTLLASFYGLITCLLLPVVVHWVARTAAPGAAEEGLPAAAPWIVMVLWLAVVAQSLITFYEGKKVSRLFDYGFLAAILLAGIVLGVKYLIDSKGVSARTGWELGSVAVFTLAWLGIPQLRPRRYGEEFWR